MPSADLQGSLNLIILRALSRGPNHGFGIAQFVQEGSEGLINVEEGSMYPALHRLERDKLIAGEWKVTGNGRRARYYSLTRTGRKALADAERRWSVLSKGVEKLLGFA